MRSPRSTSGLLALTVLLGATAPRTSATAATPMSIVIGIDGLGAAGLRAASTPELDRLISGAFGNGYSTAVTYEAQSGGHLGTATQQPTVSGPGWSTILTGVWTDQHGVTGNDFAGANYGPNPPFLEILEERLPDIYTAASVNWKPIDTQILSTADDANSSLDRRATPGNDLAVAADVAAMISGLTTARPAAIFVHLDEVDGAGHSYGSWNQGYLNEVSDTDARVGTILRAIEARPTFAEEDWQIVVTADHGHRPTGGHGGQTLLERTTPLIVTSRHASQGIMPVATAGPTIADSVPTVLAHFGITDEPHLAGTARGSYVLGSDGGSLRQGLIQHLSFDGDAAAGLAGNGGTIQGGVQFSAGRFGQAAGVAAYGDGSIVLNDDIGWQFGYSTDFTLSMWVKYDDVTGDPAFFSNKNWDSGNNAGINLAVNTSHTLDVNTKATRGTRQDLEPFGQLLPGIWQNVALTVDRQGATTLYLDGVPAGQIPQTSLGSFDGSGRFTFLNDVTGSYGGNSTTSGLMIDEFAAWNRVLTADELSFLANAPIPGLATTPAVTIHVGDGTITQAEAGHALLTTTASLTKTGAGTLVLDAANVFTGPTTVLEGTVLIATADALADSDISIKTGAAVHSSAGSPMQAASLTVAGGTLTTEAPLIVSGNGIASLTIDEGAIAGSPAVEIASGGRLVLSDETAVTFAVDSLVVDEAAGGGMVDLGVGALTVASRGIAAADLRDDLLAGRNGGGWDGVTGIGSSVVATAPGSGVGYVIDTTTESTTIAYAALGDSDLDGLVTFDDVLALFPNYGATGDFTWQQGDFTYDGRVDFDDVLAMFPNYTSGALATGSGSGFSTGSVAVVPEPGAALLLVSGSLGGVLLRRRRAGFRTAA